MDPHPAPLLPQHLPTGTDQECLAHIASTAGNASAATIMIAEKGADMILAAGRAARAAKAA